MLHRSIMNLGSPSMPVTKTLPQFPAFGSPAFGSYVDPFGSAQTALSFWTKYWQASAGAAAWWTERWMQAPLALMALAPTASPSAPVRRGAAVIDLARAAAARFAAETSDIASTEVEMAETIADVPASVAQDAVSVAATAAETVKLTPDDLTRLVGIGPKLAAALAERGVTSFAQIAAWSDKQIAELDKSLDLKGRAVRDAWVAQAKRFAAES
jgi:predicted flap endonuclease-1-like 5' DNA nuclease